MWETLLEVERFSCHAGEKYQGTVALVLDLAKDFELASLQLVWVWAAHFNLPGKILRVLCGPSNTSGGYTSKDVWRSRSILPGSNQSCLLPRIVLQDALSGVMKVYPPLKLSVFVDDITAIFEREEQGIGGVGRKSFGKVEEGEREKKG